MFLIVLTTLFTGCGGYTPSTVVPPPPPATRVAYVTNVADDTISIYSIDAANGSLTLTGSVSSGGSSPASAALHPTGRFAYVANAGSNTVAVFGINATTGALT